MNNSHNRGLWRAGYRFESSNCTSIPEIIDRQDALFEPEQPRSIAGRMAEVLSNAEMLDQVYRSAQALLAASEHEAVELADALRTWLSLGDGAPGLHRLPWLTWQESSRQLLDVVLGRRWCRSWPEAAADRRPSK